MAAVGKITEFSVQNRNWNSYVERLEMYFVVNKVEKNLRLPTLITVVGEEVYELLSNLASPKKPSELEYEEAITLLSQQLQPTPSALAERYIFRQRRQKEGEDIAQFVADLKKLARYCKFDMNLNENLRDQFVCGLRNDSFSQRLFMAEDSLTFMGAVKIASNLEAAERNAAVMEVPVVVPTVENGTENLHTIQANQNIERSLWTFLLNYRNVEHATTGECPATLLIGRRIRSHLDILRPDRENKVCTAQQRQSEPKGGVMRDASRGDRVWYRQFQRREKWALVASRLGARDYTVLTRDEISVHRHIDQLKKRAAGTSPSKGTSREGSSYQPYHFSPGLSGSGVPIAAPGESQLRLSSLAQTPEPDTSVTQQPSVPLADAIPVTRAIRQCRLDKPPVYKY